MCQRNFITPPTIDERKRELILRDGTFTSSSKKVAGITSKTKLHKTPHVIAICFCTELAWKMSRVRHVYVTCTSCVRENLHSIFCLAFIPRDGVIPCWAELKPMLSLNPSLLHVLNYVESTWVLNDIYPIHMWNVHKAVIDGGLRTNKFPEGHNHALQLTAGCSHPGFELLAEIPTLHNTDAELDI